MPDSILVTCPKCGKLYRLGQDGVITGCDACTGIVRDGRGFAWAPGQVFEVDVEKRTVVQIVRPKGG